ncbi:hypothetical protein JCM3774_001529 [Rhodotorula dairenensis]
MSSQPPLDPAIVSSERPTAVYSRAQLLALYSSPLVPNKLDGMKELSEWYGEVLPPPSPPQSRGSLNARSPHGDRSANLNSDRSSRRLLHAADSSPFANFGRFGVDGGLTGDALDAAHGRNARRVKGAFAALSSDNDKDTAPHLQGRAASASGGGGGGDRPARSRNGLEGDLSRRNAAGELDTPRRRGGASSSLEALESQSKRDARRGLGPTDEGGWRNVGMTREEREKRLTARNHGSTANDSPASRREGGAFGARTGRPAWMDDAAAEKHESGSGGGSSSSPAWMDAPATGKMSFDTDRKARASPEEETSRGKRNAGSNSGGGAGARQRELETYNPAASGASGLDGMQLFKAQMKEREKRERDRDLRARGLPVEADEPASAEEPTTAPPQSKSIFEDLGIVRAPPGLLGSPSPAARSPVEVAEQGRSSGGGGRSSRFAKFFDGKPAPTLSEAPAPAENSGVASIFASLAIGGGGGGNTSNEGGSTTHAPSKEDADSMARLLGMLQVSGQRGASPNNVAIPASVGQSGPTPTEPTVSRPGHASSPLPPPDLPNAQSVPRGGEDEAGRTKSRFKFSNPPPMSPGPQQGPPPQGPAPPGLARPGLQSPFAAASPLPPPSVPPGLASPAARSRAPTEGALSSSSNGPHHSPRSARPSGESNSMSPQPPSLTRNNFSSPPPAPGTLPQQQQPPFFSSVGPSPPPFPPNGPDGRYLSHPMAPPPTGPNQLRAPPNMGPPPPPFAFGPDGRPIPSPPHPLAFLPPFMPMPPASMPGGGGPLSPPLASPPVGNHPGPGPARGPPPSSQYPFPGPVPGQMPPPPPHHLMFPPPHFNPGQMPLPPPSHAPGQPPSLFTNAGGGAGGGGNAGADLMALLNSGAGGQRIGANGPPNGVQVRQA